MKNNSANLATTFSGRPIFILSCVRSGSTMLRYILDTNPNICSPGHLNLGLLCLGLYKASYYSIGSLPDIKTEEQRDVFAIHESRAIIHQLMDKYVQGKGGKRWCEKSTDNVDYAGLLEKLFPEAQYICLYRSCLDVVYSCIKTSPLGFMDELSPYVQRQPTNFVAAVIENWLEKTEKLIRFEENYPDKSIRVNYEFLVNNPRDELYRLFAFLGEDWNSELSNSIFKVSHDQGPGDSKVKFSSEIRRDSVGNGVQIPFTAIPEALVNRVDALHQKLGYPVLEDLYRYGSDCVGYDSVDYGSLFENLIVSIQKVENKITIHGVCKLIVSGLKGRVWRIEANTGELRFLNGDGPSDCVVSTSYVVFCKLLSKETSVLKSYENGEIAGDGNISLAFEFGRLIFGG
ncbi:hypothetical protein HC024_16495 [Methylococcaceae bacterium WWC4]|nr:hypothetical protein [Methylococcaceae bacterium WWC4]